MLTWLFIKVDLVLQWQQSSGKPVALTPLQPITNGTSNKYEIKSTPNRTSLTITDLNIESDVGDYICSGMNEIGTATDKIHLRVRSRWAALWPFLGIVAEVIILVTIIFIYEKRRKPDEINDGAYWMFRSL